MNLRILSSMTSKGIFIFAENASLPDIAIFMPILVAIGSHIDRAKQSIAVVYNSPSVPCLLTWSLIAWVAHVACRELCNWLTRILFSPSDF